MGQKRTRESIADSFQHSYHYLCAIYDSIPPGIKSQPQGTAAVESFERVRTEIEGELASERPNAIRLSSLVRRLEIILVPIIPDTQLSFLVDNYRDQYREVVSDESYLAYITNGASWLVDLGDFPAQTSRTV